MDKIASIMQTALGGIRRSLDGLRATEHEIATVSVSETESAELADPLVRALEQQRALEAAAKVLERTDDALGSLLRALR